MITFDFLNSVNDIFTSISEELELVLNHLNKYLKFLQYSLNFHYIRKSVLPKSNRILSKSTERYSANRRRIQRISKNFNF